MPSTLLFPNIIQPENKSRQVVNRSSHQEETWLNLVSIALGFGRQRKHDEKGCQQCDLVAMYYRQALHGSRQQEQSDDVLELVWQMTKMLLEHMETRLYHHLDWFDPMAHDLWMYAKWLKEDQPEEPVENAIRITIYHCRAAIYQYDGGMENLYKARLYYRKCLALSTSFDTQQDLQNNASSFLSDHPLVLVTPTFSPSSSSSLLSNHPPSLQSPTSISSTPSSISLSSSTTSSFAISACGQCGLEKKAMPVCAKCKYQRYCSIKCLKQHQPSHTLVCQK
ncbi:uncharacterized protein BX664DRAFT_334102 [Halteromyces radiatus]|uniref:uncharacterized protein n=1 Tax=Halteromyces radiatus TaxID=101107 RepID=UPI00221F23F1|nr:uncharacterized protein BX664DRAFT_334102 [Halteromyces radiatus]KAI8089862.1 hypothetical protein BX664DRAFT_334102 [Halteromyces radiatus]